MPVAVAEVVITPAQVAQAVRAVAVPVVEAG